MRRMVSIARYVKDVNYIRKGVLFFIASALFIRIPILFLRYFDTDELEHLHAARSVYHGMVPYRDFFEHHTPLFHFLLAPLYSLWGDAIPLIFAARVLMFVFTCGILYVTYRLARLFYSRDAALYSALALSYMMMFLEKTIEIRPDVPAVLLWLLSLMYCITGIRCAARRERMSKWHLIVSGFLVALAILFTQKALLCATGLSLALLWFLLDGRTGLAPKERMSSILWFCLGSLIPMGAACAYFLWRKALNDFLYWNFAMNVRWQRKLPYAYLWFLKALAQNFLFFLFGACGVFTASAQLREKAKIVNGSFALAVSLLMLVIGLFLIPVPHRQYYALFLPLLAVYCGFSIDVWMERHFFPGLVQRRDRLIAIIVGLGIVVHPMAQMLGQFRVGGSPSTGAAFIRLVRNNEDQLRQIRYILKNTTPEDTVFDGWTGVGVFRDHAYYYWFLNIDVIMLLTLKTTQEDVLNALRAKKPKIVIYDSFLRLLPPPIRNYIEENYRPSGVGDIRVLSLASSG